MYSFKEKHLLPGDFIAKRGRYAEDITLIVSGEAEVITTFEGNDFVMLRLHQGDILHCNSFLMEDVIHIDVRCKTSV